MRQKLIGLKGNNGSAVGDDTLLCDLKAKGTGGAGGIVHQFILMGTPEEKIFVDPSEKDDLPDIIDDFDLDFNAGSEEVSLACWKKVRLVRVGLADIIADISLQWVNHKAKEDNLQKFTESTEVHIINPPRTTSSNSHRPLLVLDLDHTLLDFSSNHLRENAASAMDIGSSGDSVANQLKRPYMDEFLTWTYKYYDLVVWSQTRYAFRFAIGRLVAIFFCCIVC